MLKYALGRTYDTDGVNALNLCGSLAAALTLVGYAMYGADKKRFHPDVKAWGTITAVGFLAFFGVLFSGGKESLLMLLADALLPLAVTLYSLRGLKRQALKWEKDDTLMAAVFISGLLVWLLTGKPAAGLAASTILDWRAGMIIIRKTWRSPGSEPLWSWVVTTTACMLNLAAAAGDGPEEFGYVASFTLIQTLVVAMLFRYGCGLCKWQIGFLPTPIATPWATLATFGIILPPKYSTLDGWAGS